MQRLTRRLLPKVKLGALFLLILFVAFPVESPGKVVLLRTALFPGQTTFDGSITFVVTKVGNGASKISIRNRSARSVFVDAYRISGGNVHGCVGGPIILPKNRPYVICRIPDATSSSVSTLMRSTPFAADAADFGSASLEMLLTWHTIPKIAPVSTPAPIASNKN